MNENTRQLKHIPINKEEFKEATVNIAKLFEKIYYATNIFEDFGSEESYERVTNVYRKNIPEFMRKYRLGSRVIPSITDEYTNKEERVILSKLNILCDMIDRYLAAHQEKISIDYIERNLEARICRLMMSDKTGYIRAKTQVIELSQKFMLHETKLRMKFYTREKLFTYENDKLHPKFEATYRKTVEYLECIRPDKIKVNNIIWRIY